MIFAKTDAGRLALKERSDSMPRKYHFPFLACDGVRDAAEILRASAAQGVTEADLLHLVSLGFLAPIAKAASTSAATATNAVSSTNSKQNFQQIKINASNWLEDLLGFDAQALCIQIEQCKTRDEFDARLERVVSIIAKVAGADKAATYRARVLAS
jgi:hypothetical protein